MLTIKSISALEILDSRGRPTIKATLDLSSGQRGSASVPSGASTGTGEALELRDGDPTRYRGLGCRKAVANILGPIAATLVNRTFQSQEELDEALIDLDGTHNKSVLGANAILAVSLAYARAAADTGHDDIQLYHYFANLVGGKARHLPRLTVNLFSGGKHAGGQVSIQDLLIVPASARTIDESLATVYAVFQAAADLCLRKYSMRGLRADEGGLAPPFRSIDEMLDDAVASIQAAGFTPGRDVAIALDIASSHFYDGRHYRLAQTPLDAEAMIDQLSKWLNAYPIVSIEDGLAEDDWENWPTLRRTLKGKALTLGDDFLCTNPRRIQRAILSQSADALLLKVNQIGSLTEAAEALRLARSASWRVTVSARSGETEDNWLADLAVGWSADQIKIGSITQSERLAKYNRLLEIEALTKLPIVAWPN